MQGFGRDAANTAANTANDMKERMQGFGRDAASTASDMKERIQEKMGDMGEAVKEHADQMSDSMSRAASYVSETDPQDIWNDITSTIKSRPLESLAAAAVVGFFIGRAARRM
jgi:ElaB/YqjD/DUF883 family membrane-anchored ribosome-binding protein